MEIEGIKGKSHHKESTDHANSNNGLQEAVASALKKSPDVESVSTIDKVVDIERSTIPMGAAEDAAIAATTCARLARQANRVARFIRLYMPS